MASLNPASKIINLKSFLLKLIVFLSGALTMLFEITGIRILGPFIGTSIIVWTSLIGTIMAGLAIGYWLGGKLSDWKPSYHLLIYLLLIAILFLLTTTFADQYFLLRLHKYVPDLKYKSLLASIILFGPTNIFLGMILPFAAKLDIDYVKSSGRKIGNIYALSTLGSILGSFTAGFYILPSLGHYKSLLLIVFILLALLLMVSLVTKKLKLIFLVIIPIGIIFMGVRLKKEKKYLDIDTQYNRVIIRNTIDSQSNKEIKWLFINDERSSAMYLDDDELVFEVLKYYHLVKHFNPDFKRTMMIGGSGYAFPKDFLNKYPEAYIDVIEIDPGLTNIAQKYFNLKKSPRLKIIHEDGRTFINHSQKKYDAIFLDAYKSILTVPYQLTTVEAIEKISNLLTDDGVVLANLIGNFNQQQNIFLRAEINTFKSVFPYIMLFAVQNPNPSPEEADKYQNFILIASKHPLKEEQASNDPQITTFLKNKVKDDFCKDTQILTDEYAPVEYYTFKALK